jgi:hypothetical protein
LIVCFAVLYADQAWAEAQRKSFDSHAEEAGHAKVTQFMEEN